MRQTDSRVRPRPEIIGLRPYRLRREAPVRLNQNESPLDWPSHLKQDVLRRVERAAWNRYPAAQADVLREALARAYSIDPAMVVVTNGSNEAILALVEAFATGRSVVLPVPGYSLARSLIVVGGAEMIGVPLREDFALDVKAVLDAAVRADAPLIFLASPNNPTGNALPTEEIEAVLDGAPGLVVVDEAYAGFARASFIGSVPRRSNLAVVRTFSKGFAFAGGRVGWIAADPEVIAAVHTALPPYNLNVFAQEAALVALEHRREFEARLAEIIAERERLRARMSELPTITAYPSETNFILFRSGVAAEILFERLLARGVLVRDVSSAPMLDRCLRVTVGTREENDRFLTALRESVMSSDE